MNTHQDSDPLAQAVAALGLPDGCRVLMAVSGGPDSMALLHTFQRLTSEAETGWQLRVGHVNHTLRGEESDLDERFVRAAAADLDLAVDVVRVDVATRAKTGHLSIETAARELRYGALRSMLGAWGGDLIATGHTADDQAETLIMRLLRGTALRGLGGIPPSSPDLVRPFLAIPRETILIELQHRNIGYRLDRSNLDPRHFRNRVRQNIMPALRQASPGLVLRLSGLAETLRADADYLEDEASAVLALLASAPTQHGELSSAALRSLHPALRRTMLRQVLEQLRGHPASNVTAASIHAIEALLADLAPAKATVSGGYTVAAGTSIALSSQPVSPAKPWEPGTVSIPGEGSVRSGTLEAQVLELELTQREELMTVCGPFHVLCDADSIGIELTMRPRRPGDRVRPLGAPGRRKLQDILVDRNVPERERDELVVVCSGDRIVWIPGVAVAHDAAIRAETARVIHLIFRATAAVYRDRMTGPI